jgi:dUTP pyrophosphatase
MTIKIKLDEGAILPTRAHETDAGLDLYTPVDVFIPKTQNKSMFDICDVIEVGSATIDTGVHVEIPKGYVGFIKSKSGLMVKHGLTADGTIDSGYVGSIRVKLFNHTSTSYEFKAGDKIAQLVLLPIITPDLEVVDSLEDTERGSNGFGSSGR